MRQLLIVVAVSLAACGGPTEPAIPFGVSITAPVTFQDWNPDTNRFECHYTLTATVTGEPGAEAVWFGGTVEIRPNDGSVGSIFSLGLVDLVDHWGSSTLRAGETYTSPRLAWRPDGPFRVFYTFRYILEGEREEDTGEIRSVTLFTC